MPKGQAWNPPDNVKALWRTAVASKPTLKAAWQILPDPKPGVGTLSILAHRWWPELFESDEHDSKRLKPGQERNRNVSVAPVVAPRSPTFALNGSVATAGHIARADRAIALIRDVIKNARNTGQSTQCEPVFAMIEGILAMV